MFALSKLSKLSKVHKCSELFFLIVLSIGKFVFVVSNSHSRAY